MARGIRLAPPRPVEHPSADDAPVDAVATPEPAPQDEALVQGQRHFVIATKDFSGLGWATILLNEGEDVTIAWACDEDTPELKRQMEMVGSGVVDVVPLSEAVTSFSGSYWIFDGNHNSDVADRLRERGEKVFGTSELSERMEHERSFACEIAKEHDLPSPPSHEFSSLAEGIAFLDANPDTAYVFKPDDGKFNYMTFVPMRSDPANANRDVHTFLSHMKEEPGTFILQERIDQDEALEVNAEIWFYEGEPILAYWNTELKRKNTGDTGEMTGCAGDFGQVVPLETPLIQQTIGRLVPFYREQSYTGFADVNVIFDKANQPWFLEVCNRFGYNSHPTLFLGAALDTVGNILADYMDGDVGSLPQRFRRDIAGSLTLFLDHPREGLPLHIDGSVERRFFPFDLYREDGQYLLTGANSAEGGAVDNPEAIGVLVDHAASIEQCAQQLLRDVRDEKVHFSDITYRTDIGDADYYNAPVHRYRELKRRGLL